MTHVVVGNVYRHATTGMVVVAVTRRPSESNLSRFPGRVLFPGRSGRWDAVGTRISKLVPRDFVPLRTPGEPQLALFSIRTGGES